MPIGAARIQPAGAGKAAGSPYAGLWQGLAQVDAVSEAQRGGTTPRRPARRSRCD